MYITNTPVQTAPNQTTVIKRMEKKKYKRPMLSHREKDLTKNPRMWWEQISEYIDLTYQKISDELMDLGTDSLDAQITHHIKGNVIWALGPKAKYAMMRGQWGKELKDISLKELLQLFKKTFLPTRNVFHSRTQLFNNKQKENDTLDEYWKKVVDNERKCELTDSLPKKLLPTKSQPQ